MSKGNCRTRKMMRFICYEKHIRVDVRDFREDTLVKSYSYFVDDKSIDKLPDTHLGEKLRELWDDRLEHIREERTCPLRG